MEQPTSTGSPPVRRGPHRWSVPVARISGIEVRVHVTFLLLVALFLMAAPEPGLLGAAWSVTWLLLVFSCVVVHELAHSFVARSRGAQVHEILLFPLGGISKLENLPETPRDEFAIAIVGPMASIGLGLAAAALCVVTGRALVPIDLITGAWLERIAWLNVILGVFNLLPAFPLDGGRVFRSLLERRHDLESATRIATRVGHALAIALVAFGMFFDVWLVLIGMFVYFGASAEEAATIVHVRLRGHRVREVMRPAVAHGPVGTAMVDVDAPLDLDVLAQLQAAGGALPVGEGGRVVGVLRLEDVSRLVTRSTEPA